MTKMEKQKKTNNDPNPLTCESHILTSWTLKLDPMLLILMFVPWKKKEKKKKRRVQFKSSICFKCVPRIMDLEPSLKVALSMLNVYDR